jgi:hypothetical protein
MELPSGEFCELQLEKAKFRELELEKTRKNNEERIRRSEEMHENLLRNWNKPAKVEKNDAERRDRWLAYAAKHLKEDEKDRSEDWALYNTQMYYPARELTEEEIKRLTKLMVEVDEKTRRRRELRKKWLEQDEKKQNWLEEDKKRDEEEENTFARWCILL